MGFGRPNRGPVIGEYIPLAHGERYIPIPKPTRLGPPCGRVVGEFMPKTCTQGPGAAPPGTTYPGSIRDISGIFVFLRHLRLSVCEHILFTYHHYTQKNRYSRLSVDEIIRAFYRPKYSIFCRSPAYRVKYNGGD